jgi:uncharacterized protein
MGYSIKGTIKCNMGCKYCYESNARAENPNVGIQEGYNVDKIIETIKRDRHMMGDTPPNLHGGEPLLLPKEQNEKLLKFIYEEFGWTSIQTNASLIDEDYIAMFKKYNMHAGVSIDGPDELNMGRWMGNESKTLKTTEKIMKNMKWMLDEGIKVSTISVISKQNASPDKLPRLKEWLLELKAMGTGGGRLNMIHVDYPELVEEFELSEEDSINFYKEMAPFVAEHGLRYAPFTDTVNGLLGYGHKTCVTTMCDPYHTEGEKPIYGDGSVANCLRTSKDGVVYLAETNLVGQRRVSNERYVILRQIPMEDGGCGGCRFWHVCTAHCPASSEDDDWRNKTRHCSSYYSLFEETEKSIKKTLPAARLVSDMTGKVKDLEIMEKMRNKTLNEDVFEPMNTRRGAF